MKTSTVAHLQGKLAHLVYSPRGEIEGALVETADGPIQLVFEHHDELGPAMFLGLESGSEVSVDAKLAPPSAKGEGEHPVYDFHALREVNGKTPAKPKAQTGAAYRGRVVRFNYARHGAINGVVLDTGDFLHFKPDGYAKLGLKVGDHVEADGDAQQLAGGRGWAVEATEVNKRPLKGH